MTSTDTYERLEPHEIESVRAYRRQLWNELANVDPEFAKRQIIAALRKHSDAWVDGVSLVTLVSVCLRGKNVGDIAPSQRYSLISLLEEAAA